MLFSWQDGKFECCASNHRLRINGKRKAEPIWNFGFRNSDLGFGSTFRVVSRTPLIIIESEIRNSKSEINSLAIIRGRG